MRGDIVLVNLSGAVGVEKMNPEGADSRPCIIVQNNVGEAHSPMTIIAPLTTGQAGKYLPVQVPVTAAELGEGGSDSIIECGHLRSIDRKRITETKGQVASSVLPRLDRALKISLGL